MTTEPKPAFPRLWVYDSHGTFDTYTDEQVDKMAEPEMNRAIMTPYVPEALLRRMTAAVYEIAAKMAEQRDTPSVLADRFRKEAAWYRSTDGK